MSATQAVLAALRAYQAAERDGDFAAAADVMTRLIGMDPKRGAFYARRAKARMLQGRGDEALKDAAQAIQRDPGIALAHLCRGCALVDIGRRTGNASQLKSGARALQQARTIDKAMGEQELFRRYDKVINDQMARQFVDKGAVHQNDFGVRILGDAAGPLDAAAPPLVYEAPLAAPRLDDDALLWVMCDALLVCVALDQEKMRWRTPAGRLDPAALVRDRRSLADCCKMVVLLIESLDLRVIRPGARAGLAALMRCVHRALSPRVLQVCLRTLLASLADDARVPTYARYVSNAQSVVFALLSEGDTALSLRRGGAASLAQRLVCSCLRAAAPRAVVVLLGLRIELKTAQGAAEPDLIAKIDEVLGPYVDVGALGACDEIDILRNWTAAPPWLLTPAHEQCDARVSEVLARGRQALAAKTEDPPSSSSSSSSSSSNVDSGEDGTIEAAFAYSRVIDVETGYAPWNLVPTEFPPAMLAPPQEDPSPQTCSCPREAARAQRIAELAAAWAGVENSDQRERTRRFSVEDLQAAAQSLRGDIPSRPMDIKEVAREIFPGSDAPRATASYRLFALAHRAHAEDAEASNSVSRAVAETAEAFARLEDWTAARFGKPLRRPAARQDRPLESDLGKSWKQLSGAYTEAKEKLGKVQASLLSSANGNAATMQEIALPHIKTVPPLDERILPNSALPGSLCALVDMARGFPVFGAPGPASCSPILEEAYFVPKALLLPGDDPEDGSALRTGVLATALAGVTAAGDAPGSLVLTDGWVVTKRCAAACFASAGLVPVYLGEVPLCCECGLDPTLACRLDFSRGAANAWLPDLKLKVAAANNGKKQTMCFVDNFAPDKDSLKGRHGKRKKRASPVEPGIPEPLSSADAGGGEARVNGSASGSLLSQTGTAQGSSSVPGCVEPSQRDAHALSKTRCPTCQAPSRTALAATSGASAGEDHLGLFERIVRLAETGPALADELQHELSRCEDLAKHYAAKRDETFSKGERLFNLQNIVPHLEGLAVMHKTIGRLARNHVHGASEQTRARSAPDSVAARVDQRIYADFLACVTKLCGAMNTVERLPNSLLEVTMDSPMQTMRFQASLEACGASRAPSVNAAQEDSGTGDAGSSVEAASNTSAQPLAGGANVLNALVNRASSAGRASREKARAAESAALATLSRQEAVHAFCAEFLLPLSRLSEELCVAAAVNPFEGLGTAASGESSISAGGVEKDEVSKPALIDTETSAEDSATNRWMKWRQEIIACLMDGGVETAELQTITWKQEQFHMGRPGVELSPQEARRIRKTAAVLYPSPEIAHELKEAHREAVLGLATAAADTLSAATRLAAALKQAKQTPASNARATDEAVLAKVHTLFKDQLVLLHNTVHLDAELSQQVQKNFSREDDLWHLSELVVSAEHRLDAVRRDFDDCLEALGEAERALRRNLNMRFQFFSAAVAQLLVSRLEEIARQNVLNAQHRATLLKEVEPASGRSRAKKPKKKGRPKRASSPVRAANGNSRESDGEAAKQDLEDTELLSAPDTTSGRSAGVKKMANGQDAGAKETANGCGAGVQEATKERVTAIKETANGTLGPLKDVDSTAYDGFEEEWTTVSKKRAGGRQVHEQNSVRETDSRAEGGNDVVWKETPEEEDLAKPSKAAGSKTKNIKSLKKGQRKKAKAPRGDAVDPKASGSAQAKSSAINGTVVAVPPTPVEATEAPAEKDPPASTETTESTVLAGASMSTAAPKETAPAGLTEKTAPPKETAMSTAPKEPTTPTTPTEPMASTALTETRTSTTLTETTTTSTGPVVVADICRSYLQGNCPDGDACPRRHVTPLQLHDEMLAMAQGSSSSELPKGTVGTVASEDALEVNATNASGPDASAAEGPDAETATDQAFVSMERESTENPPMPYQGPPQPPLPPPPPHPGAWYPQVPPYYQHHQGAMMGHAPMMGHFGPMGPMGPMPGPHPGQEMLYPPGPYPMPMPYFAGPPPHAMMMPHHPQQPLYYPPPHGPGMAPPGGPPPEYSYTEAGPGPDPAASDESEQDQGAVPEENPATSSLSS